MSKIKAVFKKIFAKNKVETLFGETTEVSLSELGGNYCSDTC